jgi:hypothetical protein
MSTPDRSHPKSKKKSGSETEIETKNLPFDHDLPFSKVFQGNCEIALYEP